MARGLFSTGGRPRAQRHCLAMRLAAPLGAIVLAGGVMVGCGGDDESAGAGLRLAASYLRLGEDLRAEVSSYEGELPPDLDLALNPGLTGDAPAEDRVTLPTPEDAELVGSLRLVRPDGTMTYILSYEVPAADRDVESALSTLLDETPWQVVGGQSSEAVSALNYQSTISGDIRGAAVIQPLPSGDRFEVVVERDGDRETLELERLAPIPVLRAVLEEQEGGLRVTQLADVTASAAGLRENDLIVEVAGTEVATPDELRDALRALGATDEPRVSLVYFLEITPAVAVDLPSFVVPDARPLPPDFPVPFLAPDGYTPVSVQWAADPSGDTYQIAMLTETPVFDVVDQLRGAVEGAGGWQIDGEQASGSATQFNFSREDGSAAGTLLIDTFPEDRAYTLVSLQLGVQ